MIEINLLPQDFKKGRRGFALQKNMLYVVAGGAGVLLLLVLLTFYQSVRLSSMDRKIQEARARTEQLKKDIQLVDALTEVKEKLLNRMSAIETLDRNRSVWVEILTDLSSRVPDYLWLSVFKENAPASAPQPTASPVATTSPVAATTPVAPDTLTKASRTTLEGYSYSLNGLAAFIISLMKSDYFKNVELNFVKAADVQKQKTFNFQLSCDLVYFDKEAAEKIDRGKGIVAVK